jgi:hypothetical protein
MGQQQLLLIVLGVIVVGIAVVAGMSLFQANKESAIKDELVNQNTAIAALAQAYWAKPSSMAGGNQSFVGFVLPSKMDSTTNGVYTIETAGTSSSIKFQAAPLASKYTWRVHTTVNDSTFSTVIN